MRSQRTNVTISLVITGALLATTGCSQFYNGAVGFGEATPTKPPLHTQTQAPASSADRAPAQAQRASTANDVVFADPVTGIDRLPDPAAQPDAGSRRALDAMSIFGQIDQPGRERVSPMDGPTNLTRLTFTVEGADFTPAVDRTGQYMVFASTRHRERPDLYLKKINGTTVTQLTNDAADDVMPTFSPDGKRIAFASRRSGTWDIYLMELDGRNQAIQLTHDVTQDIHPSFSPDGKRLVYSSYGSASGQWEMVVINVNNPSQKQFIGHGLFPQWSPVEDKILFQRARQRGTRWFSIWTVDLVNGEALSPTEIAASNNAAIITPAWSPDGQKIVFCTVMNPGADKHSRPGEADVWTVNIDGTDRTRLIGGPFANLQPTWGGDGTIYFVSNRASDGVENIWAVRPDAMMPMRTATGAVPIQ